MNLPLLPCIHPPLTGEDVDQINGRSRGVQGHRNSCYLDATLFSLFSFSSAFDTILIPYADRHNQDNVNEELANDVKSILREGIVNPLRKDFFTPSANVMKLRESMLHLDDKLTSEEMDPQEFLQILFNNVLKLKEFVSLSSGQSEFFHQVICHVAESDREQIPTVQQLFEQSLRQQELKLKSIPAPALILQMPRYGNRFKTYKGILPNLTLDITDLIQDSPRECIICGQLATNECPECIGEFTKTSGIGSATFCASCGDRAHRHYKRSQHRASQNIEYSFPPERYFPQNLPSPGHSTNSNGTGNASNGNQYAVRSILGIPFMSRKSQAQCVHRRVPRVTMDLYAVICIEMSHFVSFVKCGTDRLAPWVIFDSMADRVEKMDGTGHNIPQVKLLPKMGTWLNSLETETPEQLPRTMETLTTELRRLLTDPYICLYQSPEASMYS